MLRGASAAIRVVGVRARRLRRPPRADRRQLQARAERLRPGAGQGLPHRHRAAADAASLDRTDAVVRRDDGDRACDSRGRAHGGFPGSRSRRRPPNANAAAVIFTMITVRARRARRDAPASSGHSTAVGRIAEAIAASSAPAGPGLGTTGGFKLHRPGPAARGERRCAMPPARSPPSLARPALSPACSPSYQVSTSAALRRPRSRPREGSSACRSPRVRGAAGLSSDRST